MRSSAADSFHPEPSLAIPGHSEASVTPARTEAGAFGCRGTVDLAWTRHICYLQDKQLNDIQVRFDCLSILFDCDPPHIDFIENAFEEA